MSIYNSIMNSIDNALDIYGSVSNLSRVSGIPRITLSRWKNRRHTPNLKEISKLCELLHLHLVDESKFRDMSHDEDYIAVPILNPNKPLRKGIIPNECILGYCKIYKKYMSVEGKYDLVVYKLEDDLLYAKKDGMVLVDREDKTLIDNKIYLINLDNRICIGKIALCDDIVIFKCLTSQLNRFLYKVKDFDELVIGKVIWVRSDITHW